MKVSKVTRMLTALTALAMPMILLPAASHALDAAPAEIRLEKSDAGWTFVDTRGMSVYVYDNDVEHPGKSTCNNQVLGAFAGRDPTTAGEKTSGPLCKDVWPAVQAPAEAKPIGEWTPIEREDGKKQWSFKGRPLYTYVKDTYPGATVGDDAQKVWHVAFEPVATPMEVKVSKTVQGRVLTDVRGRTLYTREGETAKKVLCTEHCLDSWIPLNASLLARAKGEWSVVTRADGSRQWAFRGKLLYTPSGVDAGANAGSHSDKTWRAAVMEPPPPLPSWITVQTSDMGPVLGDTKGSTVYAFFGDLEKVKRSTCNEDCVKNNWQPVVASSDAKPIANFSVLTNKDGARQWAYKGNPLYTFALDVYPGQILGNKFASGNGQKPESGGWWLAIAASCMCSPSVYE